MISRPAPRNPRSRAPAREMSRERHLASAVYSSTDDDNESPSASMSKMSSKTPRRGRRRPVQMSLEGSDASSVGGEEEYIQNSKAVESTDSDCSLETFLQNQENTFASTSRSQFEPSSQNNSSRSERSRFKSSSKSRSFDLNGRDSTKRFTDDDDDDDDEEEEETNSRSDDEEELEEEIESRSDGEEELNSEGDDGEELNSEGDDEEELKNEGDDDEELNSEGDDEEELNSEGDDEEELNSEGDDQEELDSRGADEEELEEELNSKGDDDEEEMEQTTKDARVPVPPEGKTSVYVNPVVKKKDGSRQYNKKHHCFYCGKMVLKMSRHLSHKHIDKVDVAKAFSLPKNSKERLLQLQLIRNKGNFEHNTEVLGEKKGYLVPMCQPKRKTKGREFKHCLYCYGLYTRRSMWRHFQRCKFRPQDKTSQPGKTRVQALCAFAEPAPAGFSDAYWKFLCAMNQDKIADTIKGDHCILEYGYRLFKKKKTVVSQHQYIRQKLRDLGRLVLQAKKVIPVKSARELIQPENYNHVVTAARHLAGFSDETGKFQRLSVAYKVGYNLNSLAVFLKSQGLKRGDKKIVQDAEEFTQIYQEYWKFDTASQAPADHDQTKWSPPKLLPFTRIIQKLNSLLSEKQQRHLDALREEALPSKWKDLARVTLAQVVLLNQRRKGEVSRMPLSAYLKKDTSEMHGNLALTPLEQKLCKHFVQITILGKGGKRVPVFLTPVMRDSLDTLIERRAECGVLKENVFLFALPYSVHHIRGSDCIRQFVHECDIKDPKALTSSKTRRHIAVLMAVLNLRTAGQIILADILENNINVHGKQYRIPDDTLQLAKISKVLLALEEGRLGAYKGKSLDEIHIDVYEPVVTEGSSLKDAEDASVSEAQVSEDEASVVAPQEYTRTRLRNRGMSANKSVASMPEAQGMDDEASVTPRKGNTPKHLKTQRMSAKKSGKQTAVKRSWTPEECGAVERHLKEFIVGYQVPGKLDCERCITAEPQALGSRDWRAVKYFVKNRITALRRKI